MSSDVIGDMMNRPWEDLLYPHTPDSEGANRTELGGLSEGFRSDFWLRGYRMLEQMTGEISFVQALVLAMTGRVVNRREDRLLNTMFVNNALVDFRFWLFRTARMAATVKSPPSSCLAAGILVNDGSFLASGAAYHTSSFFYQVRQRVKAGHCTLKEMIQERLASNEIIGGFGRVLARGEDERNPSLLKVAKECDLADGVYLGQAFAIESILQDMKNPQLYLNSAGVGNALLLDLGFTPQQIMLFASFMFVIGMAGNIIEAYERPPGEFSALTDNDILYTGPNRRDIPVQDQPEQILINMRNNVRTVVIDSVSFLTKENCNDIVVCGSHGGLPAAQYALRYPPPAIVFSDGGRGKDDAGIEGLHLLNQSGIAAAAVSVTSARIGDGMDIYQHGIISTVNQIAEKRGIQQGMTVLQAIHCLVESRAVVR